jgi:hypothetical protein
VTKEEARACVEGYELANEFTAEEGRRMLFEERPRLTATLHWAAKRLGWQEKFREDEEGLGTLADPSGKA